MSDEIDNEHFMQEQIEGALQVIALVDESSRGFLHHAVGQLVRLAYARGRLDELKLHLPWVKK